jgi:hypothetical protein
MRQWIFSKTGRQRKWAGKRLRYLADDIDYEGAPRLLTSYTFTFERGRGLVFREDGKGCMLAYLGNDEYEKAHAEADNPL